MKKLKGCLLSCQCCGSRRGYWPMVKRRPNNYTFRCVDCGKTTIGEYLHFEVDFPEVIIFGEVQEKQTEYKSWNFEEYDLGVDVILTFNEYSCFTNETASLFNVDIIYYNETHPFKNGTIRGMNKFSKHNCPFLLNGIKKIEVNVATERASDLWL